MSPMGRHAMELGCNGTPNKSHPNSRENENPALQGFSQSPNGEKMSNFFSLATYSYSWGCCLHFFLHVSCSHQYKLNSTKVIINDMAAKHGS